MPGSKQLHCRLREKSTVVPNLAKAFGNSCGRRPPRPPRAWIEPAAARPQWQTSTGMSQLSSSLWVSLPSTSRSKPVRPWVPITIRSQCR